ncbi:helix-turn-helix domain-containing protein [Flavobacterium sp. MK4S-17]|uniref:helix-turn-helix domain-containing protein n=1 Tax=Flavobacterium sp. MK4S-17 TaxID=2543737 RepID=UPI00135A0E3C|nr:helix-turn-helix domain-containing protein [Flavobacterium sp. MK4S-17]
MSMYLEGVSVTELKALIKETVKEEFLAVLNEQKENSQKKSTELLTRKETSAMLGISLTTLHAWMREGILPYYRINSRIRFKSEDIQNILASPTNLKYSHKKH